LELKVGILVQYHNFSSQSRVPILIAIVKGYIFLQSMCLSYNTTSSLCRYHLVFSELALWKWELRIPVQKCWYWPLLFLCILNSPLFWSWDFCIFY
jgi:hypothetical protein